MQNLKLTNAKGLRMYVVKLDESGAPEIVKPTKLYQNSYGFVGLRCLVPVTVNESDSNLCMVSKRALLNSGIVDTNVKAYNMVLAGKETIDNTEYYCFETPMPRDFTNVSAPDSIDMYFTFLSGIKSNIDIDGIKNVTAETALFSAKITAMIYEGGPMPQNIEIVDTAETLALLNDIITLYELQVKNIIDGTGENSLMQVSASGASGAKSSAFGNITVAKGPNSHAEGSASKTYAYNSHAEGVGTQAGIDGEPLKGNSAHAEGQYTNATGAASHAEGEYTEATASYSHSEGSHTKATGAMAHSEGFYSKASGQGSHAEGGASYDSGGPQAIGDYSHAEGTLTKATGKASHAEGTGTLATADNQHASGQYNEENPDALYIVGNGTDNENRANAFEVLKTGQAVMNGAPTEDNHAVRKKELDDEITRLEGEIEDTNENVNSFSGRITQNANEIMRLEGEIEDTQEQVNRIEYALIGDDVLSLLTTSNAYNVRTTANGAQIIDGQQAVVSKIAGSTVGTKNLIFYPLTLTPNSDKLSATVNEDGSITISGNDDVSVMGTVEFTISQPRIYFNKSEPFVLSLIGNTDARFKLVATAKYDGGATGIFSSSALYDPIYDTTDSGYIENIKIQVTLGSAFPEKTLYPCIVRGSVPLSSFRKGFLGPKKSSFSKITSSGTGAQSDELSVSPAVELGKYDYIDVERGKIVRKTGYLPLYPTDWAYNSNFDWIECLLPSTEKKPKFSTPVSYIPSSCELPKDVVNNTYKWVFETGGGNSTIGADRIVIKNSGFSDTQSFLDFVTNKYGYFVYELFQATEEDFPLTKKTYTAWNQGTEEVVQEPNNYLDGATCAPTTQYFEKNSGV